MLAALRAFLRRRRKAKLEKLVISALRKERDANVAFSAGRRGSERRILRAERDVARQEATALIREWARHA